MADLISVRVTLLDTWQEVTLNLPPTARISELKRAALADSRIRRPATEYLVKFNGAELDEGNKTLAEAGITENSPLIVMSRRRVPVR